MMNRIKKRLTGIVKSTMQRELEELNSLSKENYWANVFNSSIRVKWVEDIPLNIGRWAGNYSLFYILFRLLNDVKPIEILELGLGESTKLFQAYKKNYNREARCTTIEHSKEWINIKRSIGIMPDYIDLLQMDLEDKKFDHGSSIIYKDFIERLMLTEKKFDFVLIDGPFGSDSNSRYNIIDLVQHKMLHDKFIIIFDDFNRVGEKQTVEILKKVLLENQYPFITSYYSGQKDQIILASTNYGAQISL